MTEARDDLAHHRSGRARRAFTGVLWSGVNALVPALSGLVVFVLVSRVIGPAELVSAITLRVWRNRSCQSPTLSLASVTSSAEIVGTTSRAPARARARHR